MTDITRRRRGRLRLYDSFTWSRDGHSFSGCSAKAEHVVLALVFPWLLLAMVGAIIWLGVVYG